MQKLTPLSGLQSGVVAMMLSSALIAVLGATEASSSGYCQDEIAAPVNRDVMEKLMAKKLAAAQTTLEGVTREDFAMIREATTQMIELSRLEAWEQMASPRFVQDTMDFVTACEFLGRMAVAEDAEGTSLGFVRLTMTCTNCHAHVRATKVARMDLGRQQADSICFNTDRLLTPHIGNECAKGNLK